MMTSLDPIKIEKSLDDEINMEFNHEQYELQYAAQSGSHDFTFPDSWIVCGLCGAVGKSFIKVEENQELISNIKKYMPFIDMENHFSDSICYQCSSQINSWNGFYRNCSSVNLKFNKDPTIPDIRNSKSNDQQRNTSTVIYGDLIDKISQSYNRLEQNPSSENIACTMDVLTDCLKSLISQLRTIPADHAGSCEETIFDGSNEDSESNSEFVRLIKPIDVIEVDLGESDLDIPLKQNVKLKQVHQVQSHHGTVFFDEEGYAYRVNKKQPGKLYVRCADTKCPVRGSIFGQSFRSNKHAHTHPPPCGLKNGRFPLKEKVREVATFS